MAVHLLILSRLHYGFVQKQPCVLSRVLSDMDCPLHNILHTPCQYPIYYDTLYYPQYHLTDFQDGDTVCQWLITGLDQHCATCESCLCSGLLDTAVHFQEGQFTISAGDVSLWLSVSDIESAIYIFCLLSQQFVNLLACAEWLCAAEFVLSQNPSWLNHLKDIYVGSLDALTRSDLYVATHAACPSKSHLNHWKANYVYVLLFMSTSIYLILTLILLACMWPT